MGGTSYKPLLKKYCEQLKPKRILEWGPGESTLLMREICPDAEIVTIEHQRKWFDHWKESFEKKNIKMFLIPASEEDRGAEEWDFYTMPIIINRFDLIFVDGRERVRCLKHAKNMITRDGVVILHDSERGEYAKGIELFDVVEERDDTIVLKKSL